MFDRPFNTDTVKFREVPLRALLTTLRTAAVTSPHPRHMVRLLSTVYYLLSVLGCSVAPATLQ